MNASAIGSPLKHMPRGDPATNAIYEKGIIVKTWIWLASLRVRAIVFQPLLLPQ